MKTKNPSRNIRIDTQSPYENLKSLNKEAEDVTISLEEKKLRLECIQAALVTGVRDPDIVLETAKHFWDFIQSKEKA